MNFFEELQRGRYGSFELKRQSGPNLLKGLLISVVLHSAFFASPLILNRLSPAPPPQPKTVYSGPIAVVPFEKPIRTVRVHVIDRVVSTVKRFVPVPDTDLDTLTIVLPPTQKDLLDKYGGAAPDIDPDAIGDTNGIAGRLGPTEEPITGPDVFIAREIEPRALDDNPQPIYPELARIASMEGKVWVSVFVGRDGTVRKWKIDKSTTPNAGFEEAVTQVIPRWRFTPAIQQGKPVGVWVSVPFRFSVQK